MEWKDRIARLFRRKPEWEREHRRTLIARHAENLLRERDINSVTDLVRRHRKSDLTIAGIGLTMNTATSRFLRTPEDAAGKDMLELMDAHQVERAVLLQGGYLGFQNLYSWQAQQQWPHRFLAAAAYDPYSRGRDAIVHHLFEEQGIRVVKFEVSTGSGLMATHPVFALDGEVMRREAAFAAEHGLVFVIDIGKLGSPSSQIGALRRLILRHPDMKFVVCHLLAPKQTELAQMTDGLEALHLPNVWFDLASLQRNVRPDEPPFPITRHFIARAVETVGAERLLFGTDAPSNLCHMTYQQMVDTIAQDPVLAEEQKQMILYENAKKVFWNE